MTVLEKKKSIQKEARYLKKLHNDLLSISRLEESDYKRGMLKLTNDSIYNTCLRLDRIINGN